jgi:microsomal dipeptidase-like Zn-dependent dipeptidase
VQFVQPGVADAPLSVTVSGNDVIVSLATDASGNLSSTASQVVQALNASPASAQIVVAGTWPGAAGSGIVQPRPLTSLSTVYVTVGGTPVVTCLTTVPGWCTASYTRATPGIEAVLAFLDTNRNGGRDAGEPFDTAEATWVDSTAPVLTLPGTLGVVATGAGGAPVTFAASALDAVDGPVSVACTPANGATFPIGTTTVVCTAVDQAGNTASGSFNVTVSTSASAVLQLASAVLFTKDANGRYVGSITIRNSGSSDARDLRVTTAILNTTAATLLPVQFGDVQPGTRITRQITFPDSAGTPGPANNLRVTIAWLGGSLSIAQRVALPAAVAPLWGWVDLHTHPMSNLAFGGKLFHGAPDAGSLMPAIQMPYDPQCRFDVRAINMNEALSDDAPTHGDPFQSKCGNFARNALVQALELFNGAIRQPGHAVGAPTFVNWPRWNDITHQKMWIDWIRRARDGGLRVMVALSHNNRTLAELMGTGAAISGVRNDQASSDLQITEIKSFVARHPDVMKVALTAAELYQIVQDGKIAVLLGVEVDNIGNFNDLGNVTPTMVEGEIARLYAQGVRYVFPVHLTDNRFGDTAIYDALFNIPNRRETGLFWTVGCGGQFSQIGFRSIGLPPGLNLFLPPGMPAPPQGPLCLTGNGLFLGHVNARTPTGVTSLGEFAIRTMMKYGMIVDVDHLSDRAVETVLGMAESVPGGGYPLVSGHSAVRDGGQFNAENSRSRSQLQRIGCLQGMFGLGTDGAEAYPWASQYLTAFTEMGRPTALCPDKSSLGKGRVALGTDTNSLVKSPRPTLVELRTGPPRFSDIYNPASAANDNPLLPALSRSTAGSRTFDYNIDGVAHYGMYADFVKDLRTAPVSGSLSITGKDLVDNHLLQSADYFFRMWQRIESQKTNVP